ADGTDEVLRAGDGDAVEIGIAGTERSEIAGDDSRLVRLDGHAGGREAGKLKAVDDRLIRAGGEVDADAHYRRAFDHYHRRCVTGSGRAVDGDLLRDGWIRRG